MSFNYDLHKKRPFRSQTNNLRTQFNSCNLLTHETTLLVNSLKVKSDKKCTDQFLEFILLPENKNAVFLSTNESSQNMSLVLKLLTEANLIPRMVKNINTFILLKLKCQNITFLNISNFFKGSKTEIARQFLFKEKLIYFPVHVSTGAQSKQQTCPSFSFFTHWLDSKDLVDEKKRYFDSINKNEWDFQNELVRYTFQQTEIVAHACLSFLLETFYFQDKLLASLNRSKNGLIFPFCQATPTISSFSYALLRYFYLNHENIISSPNENLCRPNLASRPELEFVYFMEYLFPEKKFIHFLSRPAGQYKFEHYGVDLYSPVTKEIFQFQGCYTHFHLPPKCKNPSRQHLDRININSCYSFKTLEQHEIDRKKFETFLMENFKSDFQSLCYVYECEFDELKKNSPTYSKFLEQKQFDLKRPLIRLHPRTAQRGGLTETYQFFWSKESSPKSRLIFADVVSMYPYCGMAFNYGTEAPINVIGLDLLNIQVQHQKICYKNKPLSSGLIFCEILAPTDLLWPFLQYRTPDQSVYLGLCRTCCIKRFEKCRHKKDRSRSFTSTWTIIEINKALELGYKVLNIYEVVFFDTEKPVLREFLTRLSSLRLSNSYSDVGQGTQHKNAVCDTINKDLNLAGTLFEVKPEVLCDNPMKKSFYKLQSNSVLGKLSSHVQLESTEIVQSRGELELLLSKHHVTEVNVIDDNHLMVSYQRKSAKSNSNFNIFIGAQVSAFAKIVLYNFMLKLKEKNITILSIDTDCIIYELPDHIKDPLETSMSFTPGHLKPVLDENCEILSYCALGTRNYSILYKDGIGNLKSMIKCKGLSYTSAQLQNQLDFSVYNKYLQSYMKSEIESIRLKQVRLRTQKKDYLSKKEVETHFTFNNDLFLKRIVRLDGTTLPFGYKEPN
jgi:hypothetical protein